MGNMRLTKAQKKQVKVLAELAYYGLEWVEGNDDVGESRVYKSGTIEGIGHMVACGVSQWFTHEGEPTGDMIDFLKLTEFPSREQIEERILEYLEKVEL